MQPYFLDSVTLQHFAAVDRLDFLELFARDHPPHWTYAVWAEVSRGSQVGISHCAEILECDWLAKPIEEELDSLAIMEIFRIRTALSDGRPPADSLKHLGEAESMYLAKKLQGVFVTDDRRAYDLAAKRGIAVRHTVEVIESLVAMGDVTCPQGWECIESISNHPKRTLYVRTPSKSDIGC